MRPLHIGMFGLLLLVIIGILVLIWYFEGPDQGGYEQIKTPPVDLGITAFLGAYLPLLLLPFLLFFIIIVCFMRLRVQSKRGGAILNVADMPEEEEDDDASTRVDDKAVGASRGPVGTSGAAIVGPPTAFQVASAPRDAPTSSLRHLASPVAVVAPAPVYATPIRGDGGDVSSHLRHSPLPPHPPPHGPPTRPIPPLPEFDDTPSLPSRNGLPSYDSVVYQQLCNSPVSPGAKKQQQQQYQQVPAHHPQMQHLQPMQHSMGSMTQTPVFERTGMKSAHSTTSISRGRVGRTPNQSSKESAL